MKPFSTLSHIRRRSAEAIISQANIRNVALIEELRRKFNSPDASNGGLLQQPIIEGAHPFVPAETNMGGVPASVLNPQFVAALDALPAASDYRFPKTRLPFRHQLQAWQHLSNTVSPQSVLVTSGTGSGKTECFLFPILSDLVSQVASAAAPLEGVQAIMLYPLNALIESQRERLSAWTKPFGGKIRYCLYNGDLEKSLPASDRREKPEQQIDREQLRESPPPVLVTNVTMLEYMLARSEDQPIIQKSKGKLKWIVLDEAHSLVGAAAAEIALLLRRVLLAFDCKPEEVHFVATSATIGSGSDVQNQLKRFLADVAGIADANVHVVEGKRQLPDRPAKRGKLPALDHLETLDPKQLFDTLAADDAIWNFIEKKLFESPQPLGEFERIARGVGLDAESFLEVLSQAARPHPRTDEDERLAPMRIHSFERAVPGVWSCVNPQCPGAANGWSFGSVFLDRRDQCPACNAPVLEVISCNDCGEVLLEGEQDAANDRILPARRVVDKDEFEFEATRDDDGQEAEDGEAEELEAPAPSIYEKILLGGEASGRFRPMYLSTKDWRIAPFHTNETVAIAYELKGDACPCCATNASKGIDRLLRPMRFGAPFMITNAAPILLEGVDPSHEEGTVPSHGRRLLSFTDSRQGTARMSAKMQAEAERNFVRSFVYHSVQHSLTTGTGADTSKLEADIVGLELALSAGPNVTVENLLAKMKEDLTKARGTNSSGIQWQDLVERLARRPEVERWMKDVWEPRDGRLFYDSIKLADFLLMREFARRPRKALSIETLGLARLRFKEIDDQHTMPSAFARYGKTIEDWRTFLYTITTYFMRANAAVAVHSELMHWITPRAKNKYLLGPGQKSNGDKRYRAWPFAPKNAATLSTPQILLINGLGLDISNQEHKSDIEECFDRAWQQLQTLFNSDPENRALDIRKAYIAPMTEGFLCPLTRRILEGAPFGLSPASRTARHATKRNAERFRLPVLPRPLLGNIDVDAGRAAIKEWLELSDQIKKLRDEGAWNNISDRVAMFADYARSAEHSAQQESALLRRYEEKFKGGEINILNCSTTMEMGVDIGSVSTVMMTNVPPSIASYKQRVGRAGRRGQPFSLAFTFCRDRPLDREAFLSPIGYLNRNLAAPKVALSSRPIVQRHVNAYLLRCFMLDRGGDPIRMMIGPFIGTPAVVGEKRITLDQRPVHLFKEWLKAPSTLKMVSPNLEKLVKHSVLEGETTLVDTCHQIISELESNFESEWEGLQALAKDEGVKDAGKSRMGLELKRLCEEFLLSALADRGFLPGHGFPTGVVTFLPHKQRNDTPPDGRRTTRLTGPQRSLDLAIRDYAPGSEIVLDGLVHKSAGVLLNWKRPASEDSIRDVQSLKVHWTCRRCGTSDSSRTKLTECPVCAGAVTNNPYLRPAGFSVDVRDKAHAETDIISYVAPEEPSVSVRASPWSSLPIPDLGRFRSSREGAVYYSNRGQSKNGYALCLHCGRASPDYPTLDNGDVDQTVASPLALHAPLRWKKGENAQVCEGNNNAWAVRRNLDLGYEISTDVFELQPSMPTTKATATALVIAMREGIARILGIEADEMGFATQVADAQFGTRSRSMLVFDRAAGGAGFAASITDRLPEVFVEARNVLDCPNTGCTTGCAACVLVPDAPFEEGSLDRLSALKFLDQHLSFHRALPDEDRISKDAVVSINVEDEVDRILRESIRPSVYVYLPETTDLGQLANWPVNTALEQWLRHSKEVVFVVPESIVHRGDNGGLIALYDLGQRYMKAGGSFPVHVGQPLKLGTGAVAGVTVTSAARTTVWATRDSASWEVSADWGQAATCPIVRGTVDGIAQTSPLEKSLLLPSPSAKFDKITSELDHGLTLFGGAMASRIRSLLGALGISANAKVTSIGYSDPYVKSPLTAKMFIDTVAALVKGSPSHAVMLSTTAPGGKAGLPTRLHEDWRNSLDAQAVLAEYALQKGVALVVRFERVPHGRYMNLKFEDGVSATVVFDQGFGAWRVTSTGNLSLHDFRSSPKRQADALERSSASVGKGGFGPTYLIATRD
ncbi:DEAD/DEAH box helicase [Agrobacterium tumefaciens]|uniref:DEAD/DEAH box helicase n=1 Tax=Agrobacterium tumefaciens TaxID=358 RepID=UPI001571697F|nr:DEAD/DEAH box helicase [Agrobacterium tumefaciens]NTE66778.1 DEAD/DEAH box helicase [Agrobacterium tumefaciens]